MSTRGVDAPYSNEIWSVIPRLSAMRSNCSMVGLSFPQLILFRYCLVQPNLLASSASLMHFSTNAFFKSIFVSFFIFLAFGRGTPKSKEMKRKKDDEKRNKDRPQKSFEGKNMSEKELATRLGWSKQYLNRISCGRANPTVEQLERIAESLGMTLHISFE